MVAPALARFRRLSGAFALALIASTLALPAPAWAQIRPIVTDQAALSLPGNIGPVGADVSNQAGDFAFADSGGGAVFLKRAGSPSLVRLLQTGDPVPGMPNTSLDMNSSLRINASGLLCLQFDHYTGDGLTSNVILTYDGSTYRKIAAGSDTAPGSGGSVFGRAISGVAMNDAGEIAFSASLLPLGAPSGTPSQTTLFIVPSGGSPVRIVGPGDTLPDSGGATITQLSLGGFNNQGEELFRAGLSTGGYGYYVASMAGVRKIAAHGDPRPGGGTIDFSNTNVSSALLNNLGQVAFRASDHTVYLHTVASGLVPIYDLTTPVPPPLETRSLTATGLGVFTESGGILFVGTLSGTSANNSALFRYSAGNPLEIVAYKGQAAPGTTAQAFSTFSAQMNAAGDVAFSSSLTPAAPVATGVFKKPAGGSLAAVVLHGEASGVAGGGTFASPSAFRLIADGSVYFESSIAGGTATYGSFVAATGGIQTLVTDLEPLPAGSRVVFRTLFVTAAGDHVGFNARRAGSTDAMVVHNVLTGVTSKAAAIGDPVPAGGTLSAINNPSTVYVNGNGSVPFGASVSGTSGYVIAWDVTNGIRKIAGPGDIEPSSGEVIKSASLTSGYLASPMNAAGQVAISATFTTSGATGLYVAAVGQPLVKVVRANGSSPYGDGAPSGGTFSSVSRWLLNSLGQVAFVAVTRIPDGSVAGKSATGIYVWSPASGTVQTVWASDPGASVTVNLSAFDDSGRVVFFAPDATGLASLYVGSGGTTPQAVALNGAAAPAGGNYAFASNAMDARINPLGDLLFHAPLTGGTSDSGYFLRRGRTGVFETVALQGQTAPGSSSPFQPFQKTLNSYPGEHFALGPTGEALFLGMVYQNGAHRASIYRYRTSGVLELVVARGDPAPESGGGTVVGISQGFGAGRAGGFYVRAAVADGATFGYAIYGTRLTPAVTWASPAPVPTGLPLGPDQLNATADVPGTFAYTPAPGAMLPPGVHTLSVTFTPADAVTYEPATAEAPLVVLGQAGADVTGDGKSDVLWRHATQGDVWLWPMAGAAKTAETYVRTIADTTWEIRAVGDFDADGDADLLWRHAVTGDLYFWPMTGAAPEAETYAGRVDPAYDIVGAGDFDGDGKADLLWRHTAWGDVWVWLMDGPTPLSQMYVDRVDPSYVVKGVGDLDADGRADIVWHGAAGDVWAWPMNGTTRLDQVWVGTVPDTGYQIQGVADFTGDLKADLVWWHTTRGEVWLWTMNGPATVAQTWVGTVPDTGYRIVATGDYDGDGKADILWHHATRGEVWVWLMDGATKRSETWVGTVPEVGYQIVKMK